MHPAQMVPKGQSYQLPKRRHRLRQVPSSMNGSVRKMAPELFSFMGLGTRHHSWKIYPKVTPKECQDSGMPLRRTLGHVSRCAGTHIYLLDMKTMVCPNYWNKFTSTQVLQLSYFPPRHGVKSRATGHRLGPTTGMEDSMV